MGFFVWEVLLIYRCKRYLGWCYARGLASSQNFSSSMIMLFEGMGLQRAAAVRGGEGTQGGSQPDSRYPPLVAHIPLDAVLEGRELHGVIMGVELGAARGEPD